MKSLHLHDAHYTCLNSINENTLERLAKISRVWNKCVWVDGIREKDTQQCNIYFLKQFNNLLTLPRQDNTPTTKAHSSLLRRPLTQTMPGNWKSSSLSLSVILNYWSSPNFPPLLLLLLLYSAFTQLQVAVLSQQTLQFNEESLLDECVSVKDVFGCRTVKMWGTIGHVNIDVDSEFVCCAFFIVHHCLSKSECDWLT